jgi:hypothetical protein
MSTIEQLRSQVRERLEHLQTRAHASGAITQPDSLSDIIAHIPTLDAETLSAVDAMLDGRVAYPWRWWRESRRL